MRCPECEAENCTRIEIHLKDEHTVQFFSCRRCEAKWWENDEGTIALDDFLTMAAQGGSRSEGS